jgi:type I restriction enzyme S subunit
MQSVSWRIGASTKESNYRFLAYYLESHYLNIRGLVGDGLRDGLNLEHLKAIPTPLPPMREQSVIVRFLRHMDRRIRKYIRSKQNLIKVLEEQKQVVVQQAVTRGVLNPSGDLKSSAVKWLGNIPNHWDVRRAKWHYREVDERSTSGSEELLSVSHITGVTPRSQKIVTMFMAASYIGHKKCQPNDLVVNTMWAWMGALGIARMAGIVSPSYAVYRPLPSSKLQPEFSGLLLKTHSYIAEYVCRSTGIRSSRLRLYPEDFLRIPLVCPPPSEQEAIIAHVQASTADLDRAIATALRETQLIREYRSRLIADVVSGKVDVRDVAEALPDEPEEEEPEELVAPDLAEVLEGDAVEGEALEVEAEVGA